MALLIKAIRRFARTSGLATPTFALGKSAGDESRTREGRKLGRKAHIARGSLTRSSADGQRTLDGRSADVQGLPRNPPLSQSRFGSATEQSLYLSLGQLIRIGRSVAGGSAP